MPSAIIIDDEQDIAQSLSIILEMKGIPVLGIANDGKAGFELYKKTNPGVAITDMKMPNFDGSYAIEKIKEYDPEAKIIVVTGYASKKPQAGEVSFIFDKPYKAAEIVEAVNKL